MDNLKEKTAQGLFWSAINSGMTQVLNLDQKPDNGFSASFSNG